MWLNDDLECYHPLIIEGTGISRQTPKLTILGEQELVDKHQN
jgi:hypothetical protein